MGKLDNIQLDTFRRFLKAQGLTVIRTEGGHEMWCKDGMTRNAVFQTHIEPVPEFVIRNNNLTIGITSSQFEEALKKNIDK